MIKLYLYSQSARRRALLKSLNIAHEACILRADEPRAEPSEKPLDYLRRCVEFKEHYARKESAHRGKRILAVADTIVCLEHKTVLGKASSAQEALDQLKSLSGKTHEVWTRFALSYSEGSQKIFYKSRALCSRVTFRAVNESDFKNYVNKKLYFGKAGSYGFQDEALKFVKKIEGSYTNVVGLPILEFKKDLIQLERKVQKQ